jgi:mutator protein MutT
MCLVSIEVLMIDNAVTPKVLTAHAILRLSDKFVLQLRDNKPDIAAPGQWSLFGGKLEPGELPQSAIRRELFEELGITPEKFSFLWETDYYFDFVKGVVRTWFFVCRVDKVWDRHQLKEGQQAGVFSYAELEYLNIPEVIRNTLVRFNAGE